MVAQQRSPPQFSQVMSVPGSIPFDTLMAAFKQSMSSIVITDADLDHGGPFFLACNDAFCRMTGYEPGELVGKNLRILQGPATDRTVIDRLRTCLHTGELFHGKTVNYRKDGQPYFVEWNISAVRDEQGKICNYVSVQLNISAQIEAEMQRDLLAMALEKTNDCVMVMDDQDHIIFVNNGFERLTGYTKEQVIGKSPQFVTAGELAAALDKKGEQQTDPSGTNTSERYLTIRKPDGSQAYLKTDVSLLTLPGGMAIRKVYIGKDVTAEVQRRQRLEALAQTDPLTGLLNRRLGDEVMHEAIRNASQTNTDLSLVMCDIDHFKRINDTYGHVVGDAALKQVAALLKRSVRAGDACMRWGGEEFLLLLPGCPLERAQALAERIRASLADMHTEPFGCLTMSMGVAQWNRTESLDAFIERADHALYNAKRTGRNRVCVSQ